MLTVISHPKTGKFMRFERISDVSVCWQDFSNMTELEKVVADVGNTLKSWDLKSETVLEHEFRLGDDVYRIQFVPNRSENSQIPLIEESVTDEIRALFGIDSGFFLVLTNEIPMEIARDFLSVCSTVFDSILGDFPFLMRLSIPMFRTFLGRRNLGNGYSVFSSRMETEALECFSSFRRIVDEFKQTNGVSEYDIDFSARLIFTLDNGQLICYEWQRQRVTNLRKMELDFRTAPVCFTTFQIPESNGVEAISIAVEKLAKCKKEWKPRKFPYKEPKWVKKASPKKPSLAISVCPDESLISFLAWKLTKENFDETWNNFRKWTRETFDKRRTIKSIPLYEATNNDCVLYQNLQLLGYGISKIRLGGMKNGNYFVTSEQLKEIDRIIKRNTENDTEFETILKSRDLALSVKARDPAISFANFQSELITGDKKTAEILWNAVSPSLFDYVQQCEMAIDYIDGLTPREVLPLLCYVLCCDVLSELKKEIENLNIDDICQELTSIDLQSKNLDQVVEQFRAVNRKIGQLQSNHLQKCNLLERFPTCEDFIDELISKGSLTVPEGHERSVISQYLRSDGLIRSDTEQTIQVILSSESSSNDSVVHQRLYVSTDRTNCLVASTTTELFK